MKRLTGDGQPSFEAGSAQAARQSETRKGRANLRQPPRKSPRPYRDTLFVHLLDPVTNSLRQNGSEWVKRALEIDNLACGCGFLGGERRFESGHRFFRRDDGRRRVGQAALGKVAELFAQ